MRLSSSWTRVLGCTTAGAFGFGVIVGVVPAIDDDEAARFVEDGAIPPMRSKSEAISGSGAISVRLRGICVGTVGSGSIRSSKDTDRVVTESDVGTCEGSKTRAVGPCVAGDVPLPVSSWEETTANLLEDNEASCVTG